MGSATQWKQDLIIRLLGGNPSQAPLARDIANFITENGLKIKGTVTVSDIALLMKLELLEQSTQENIIQQKITNKLLMEAFEIEVCEEDI